MKKKSDYNGQSGVYVSVNPTEESKKFIKNLILSTKPPFQLGQFEDEAHTTIMYSRKAKIDEGKLKIPGNFSALPVKLEFWDGHDGDGYVVLSLISKQAEEFHNEILSLGAEHSFKDYHPHMTILHGLNKDKVSGWIDGANEYIKKNTKLIWYDTVNVGNCKY